MADGDASTPLPAAPGNTNTTALASGTWTAIAVTSLKVVGHHGLMLDNDTDDTGAGLPMPDPTWQGNNTKAQPVSLTAGAALTVELAVTVSPPDAPALACDVAGAPTGWTQTWTATGLTLQGGANTLKLDSGETTGASVREVDGDLVFTFDNHKDAPFRVKVPSACIFLTVGAPVDLNDTYEQGITVRHVRRAVRAVAATGANDVHGIAQGLMALVPHYTLLPASEASVPKRFHHPDFISNGLGGAWCLLDFLKYGAECQAICRMVRAILFMAGLAANASLRVVWADPDEGATGPAHDDPWEGSHGLDKTRTVDGEAQWAALSDTYVEQGVQYTDTGRNTRVKFAGLNHFECCLRVEAGADIYYYGGGAGRYANAAEVILCFSCLVWVARVDGDTVVVREVVRRWRDASDTLLPQGGG
jgi:hypothetical protein